MALPIGGDIVWPPKSVTRDYDDYKQWGAWFGGSTQELTRIYSGYAAQDRTNFFDPTTTAQPSVSVWNRMFFWARQEPGAITRQRYHVPLAADISTTSADQLFSDEPRILIPEAHLPKAKPGSKKVQDRIEEILEEGGVMTRIHEGAEIASSLGGAFLQAHWDKEVADEPLLQVIGGDNAIPYFTWGELTSVIFWRWIETDGSDTWRHLELHEAGTITHGLYRGTSTKLGARRPLRDLPETAMYAVVADEAGVIKTGLPGLDCVYVANMRPHRTRRSSDLGRSDYQGCEGLMDALDETMTSWMRDIRLGKARMFVPEEFVKGQGRGKGSTFNLEQEIYELLKMTPQSGQPLITPNQFAIRVDEHERTVTNLIERIVQVAGYSGSTFGLKGEALLERTATEVMAREHRTVVTRGKKIRYWSRALSDILEIMLIVDQQQFKGPGVFRPRADFPESVHDSLKDSSQAILQLDQASAVSQQTKVQMAHPMWDPDEVDAEVQRLKDEKAGASPPAITTQPPPTPGRVPSPLLPGGGNNQ